MKNPTLLVIDDDRKLARAIERALKREYNVVLAHNGARGLKVARRVHPTMIILDVVMPGLDGFDLCQALREDPVLGDAPILFMSGMAGIESRIKGFEVGGDDYLIKPFDLRELQLRVRAILRRSQQDQPPVMLHPVLHHGELTLDCRSYVVTAQGKACQLTPIEFELLYHFIHHPGQTFSTERLLQDVWDYPAATGSADLVRMHIRNLRHKIELEPGRPRYIQTVYRHGYIMPEEPDQK